MAARMGGGSPKAAQDEVRPLVVDGIDVSAARARVDDWEFLESMADLVASEGVASLSATVRYMRELFGDDYARVKAELRERNGGRLTVDDMNGFAMAVIEAAGAKN